MCFGRGFQGGERGTNPALAGDSPFNGLTNGVTTSRTQSRRRGPACQRDWSTGPGARKHYAGVAALDEDLRRCLAHEPIRAWPTPWWERGRKWVQRWPWLASSATHPPSPHLIQSYHSLGDLYGARGHLDQAAATLRQARDFDEQLVRVYPANLAYAGETGEGQQVTGNRVHGFSAVPGRRTGGC